MESTPPDSEWLEQFNHFQYQQIHDQKTPNQKVLGQQIPILDLRSEQQFCEAHLMGSSHFLLEGLPERLYELPKTDQSLKLVGYANQLEHAEAFLSSKGYQVSACLTWCDSLELYLSEKGLLEKGSHSTRLWSPAPVVEWFHQNIPLDKTDGKKALDIACGSGRDAVYLASKGWQVSGIDYSSHALKKAHNLANRHGLNITTYEMDIEKDLSQFESLDDKYNLINVVRYLNRELFPIIRQKLAPNGYLIYQTFLVGCEKFSGPKNPRFLLQPNELGNYFNDFDVILDEIEYLPDGRPTNIFIAQKT